jgi:hypothetical protein
LNKADPLTRLDEKALNQAKQDNRDQVLLPAENLDQRIIKELEQLGRDALDLDILPTPFNRSADKLKDGDNDDGGNDIDNNTSLYPAKRQRSASPRCELNLPHASTPPLPYNEDVEGSTKNADGSDSDESEDDNFLSKRQKISDSLGGSTALSSHDGRSQHSRSSISEDAKDDDSESIAVHSNHASTARTTPDAFESAFLAEPQLGSEVIDADQEWEVRKILGREHVGGVLHYLVEWSPTLEPEHSLPEELVHEFEAHLRRRRKAKKGRRGAVSKIKQQAVVETDASGGQQHKQRGRPRKQK